VSRVFLCGLPVAEKIVSDFTITDQPDDIFLFYGTRISAESSSWFALKDTFR
jgi:hypothetical protein